MGFRTIVKGGILVFFTLGPVGLARHVTVLSCERLGVLFTK